MTTQKSDEKIYPCPTPGCNSRIKIPPADKPVKIKCPTCVQVFEFDPGFEEIYLNKGADFVHFLNTSYITAKNFERALELANRKTILFPADEYGYIGLGMTHNARLINAFLEIENIRKEVVNAFEKAIELKPGNSMPYISLILFYFSLGAYADAEKTGEKFLSLSDRDLDEEAEVLKLLAEAATAKSETEKAIGYLTRALDSPGPGLEIHFQLGRLFQQSKKHKEALNEFLNELDACDSALGENVARLQRLPSYLLSILSAQELLDSIKSEKVRKSATTRIEKSKTLIGMDNDEINERLSSIGLRFKL